MKNIICVMKTQMKNIINVVCYVVVAPNAGSLFKNSSLSYFNVADFVLLAAFFVFIAVALVMNDKFFNLSDNKQYS